MGNIHLILGNPNPYISLDNPYRDTSDQEALDTTDKGYQAPLDESLVKEFEPEDCLGLGVQGWFRV